VDEEVISTKPAVVSLTAPNPGPKTLEGTRTYIAGNAPAYVIDPGPVLGRHLDDVSRLIDSRHIRVAGVLLTHSHPDHAPAAPLLAQRLAVPVLASRHMAPREACALGVTETLSDGDSLRIDDVHLVALETPGHAPDHLSFWLPAAGLLFSGDVILGRGTTLVAPPEGDMRDYMRTLGILQRLGARTIAPGHGPIIHDPAATIETYVRHRKERETRILAALEVGPSNVSGVVAAVYTDVDPSLLPLAAGSVEAQLLKLVSEGKVSENAGLYQLACAP